ncbi:MAG TPA: histone-like nucleoid-structuring protein Lsr2 [Streptomyces sp.]|uniref:Lsr2 family DNA-binding protein n=1 Tax=Streptomyces sp. TaxID=1931 RepID=UPI002CE5F36B|nr:histone-like nucleoid-structuring protein Lsr2 [Streptomyces sp.]HWU07417.1 histone-like nucleoid-structuring protein Lsr2 [Streptomyces sp.]
MRKTVLVPVQKTLCDAHIARDGSEEEATQTLTLGVRTWDLCVEHNATFGRYLVDALGTGVHDTVEPESVPVAEPAPVAEPEPEAESEVVTDPLPVRSVMIAGEVPGYDWETVREAVRNLGYQVVGRADESTVLLILGDGGERNGSKLRDASDRGIPCMDVREPGRFKSVVCAGELVGSDPLPEPAKVGPQAMSERERNRAVRAWARTNGYEIPTKGRIPMHVRHAFELTHRDASEGKAAAA